MMIRGSVPGRHVRIPRFSTAVHMAAMAAYRIHATSRGDPLFVAREPLPAWAKSLNLAVVATIIVLAVVAWRAWPW